MLNKLLVALGARYESALETYISSREPKDIFDVERLEKEFWRTYHRTNKIV